MTQPLRVYLSGPAGAGKSTVARLLETEHGFTRVSLGDICREECRRRGWREDRAHLQAAGDLLRGAADDGVVQAADAPTIRGPLVVEGVRLAAEALHLRARGFVGIAVDAPRAVRASRLRFRDGTDRIPDHATERAAPAVPVDVRLLNTGSDHRELSRLVRELVARLALRGEDRARRPDPAPGHGRGLL